MSSIITISGGHALSIGQGNMSVGRNVPIPAVWYDFSDISTLWQDSGMTTPVTTNGDPIGAVEDKTVNAQHLTQATAGNRPTYTTNVQNGLSVADTDTSGNALYLDRLTASWTTIPRPFSLYAVGRTPDTVSGSFSRAFVAGSDTGSGSVNMWLAPTVTNGGTWTYRTSAENRNSVTYPNFAAVGADTWYITEMHAPDDGSDFTLYQNGVLDPVSAGLTPQDIIRGFRLGHDRNLGSKSAGAWQGLMGEVRVYGFNADLLGIRATIYSEIASKWGL